MAAAVGIRDPLGTCSSLKEAAAIDQASGLPSCIHLDIHPNVNIFLTDLELTMYLFTFLPKKKKKKNSQHSWIGSKIFSYAPGIFFPH